MIRYALSILATVVALPALADGETGGDGTGALDRWYAAPETVFEAAEVDLDDFKWIARPIVVFADSPANPAFVQQMDLLLERQSELVARDVILVTDTDPAGRSEVRTKLRPRGFSITLIGKDGGVKLRKPFPWDVRELTRSIDKMPMRQQELRARRDGGDG